MEFVADDFDRTHGHYWENTTIAKITAIDQQSHLLYLNNSSTIGYINAKMAELIRLFSVWPLTRPYSAIAAIRQKSYENRASQPTSMTLLGEYAASLGHFTWLCLGMGWVIVVGTVVGRNLNPLSPRNLVISNQIALVSPNSPQYSSTEHPTQSPTDPLNGAVLDKMGCITTITTSSPGLFPYKMGGEKPWGRD